MPVVVGATVGALVESALGATLEGPGILNNDMLNFINTAVAAAVALASRDSTATDRATHANVDVRATSISRGRSRSSRRRSASCPAR